MDAVDFLYHETPPTSPGVDKASNKLTTPPALMKNEKADELAKRDAILLRFQMSRCVYSGQGFPWLIKALCFWGHCNTFVNVCGYNALCSTEGQGGFRLRRLGSLIAVDPNEIGLEN
ncbi:hypothetical protein TNCV_1373161 [Trichonephila clavipes]|uniref:Uncharacterized protein n=1 Tax=Trichonephila clavipes TaxID=2585209 RepID=A0A8X6WGX8_TRICX|nr:hypothetical protein TNCV_1373161 [Trichonephila clavipes]